MLAADEQQAKTVNKGHGRVERRTIRTATALNGYLDWPDVGQVFCLRRERTCAGTTSVEEVYGITSLTRAQADAATLLRRTRDHWGIENGSHHVRDVTWGEDRCRVRKGAAAVVLAGLRNAALALLTTLRLPSIAEATRACVFRPRRAIRLLFQAA